MKRYRDLLDQRLAPLRTRYDALAQREQVFVAAAGVVIVLALIYLLIWKPAVNSRDNALRDLEAARSVAERLEIIGANLAEAGAGASGALVSPDASLLSAVDLAAKNGTLGKLPSKEQPDGDTRVRVFIDAVQFEKLVIWINELQTRYGVAVNGLEIERQADMPGLVNARLTLVRGS